MLRNLDTIYYIPRSSKNFSTEINFSENIFLVYRGRRLEEGENEDDNWITVTGRDKAKKILKPKLKPTLHNAFAILSQPDDPANYNMSKPPLQMDDDKTIILPDP